MYLLFCVACCGLFAEDWPSCAASGSCKTRMKSASILAFWRRQMHILISTLQENDFSMIDNGLRWLLYIYGSWIIIAWYVCFQVLCAICSSDSTSLPNLQGIFTSTGRPRERVIWWWDPKCGDNITIVSSKKTRSSGRKSEARCPWRFWCMYRTCMS